MTSNMTNSTMGGDLQESGKNGKTKKSKPPNNGLDLQFEKLVETCGAILKEVANHTDHDVSALLERCCIGEPQKTT